MEIVQISNPFGGKVYRYEAVDSTMKSAREHLYQGEIPGFVVIADYQHAGMGRVSGRRWESEPGKSLLFTLTLEKKWVVPIFQPLSMIIALGISRMLEQRFSLHPELKWPNDLLIGGKKVCGILCESYDAYVTVGVGLNVSQDHFSFDRAPTAAKPVSIRQALGAGTGSPPEPLDLLAPLLEAIFRAVKEPAWRQECSRRLHRRGEEVSVLVGDPSRGQTLHGLIAGIGESGQLLLDTGDGSIREIFSAELPEVYRNL
jgi:BirA family transcriptional regulator, biotin operon repressor / biotin---[acetyl-CoA-carboxylase] ligase